MMNPADPNPSRGEKGAFRKVTVTLPQAYYEQLVAESARRKINGTANQLMSSILREAVQLYLGHLSERKETLAMES